MYNFDIVFSEYQTKNVFLEDIQRLCVSGICIVAKNDKFGGFYFSKYIDKRIGNFRNVCGSNNYPTLKPQRKNVILHIKNFPHAPVLETTQYQPHIMIKNICAI